MARFSFSIPDNVAELLDRDVVSTGKSRSSLIAEYIERYYTGKTQHAESVDVVQRVKGEHEKKVQHLIAEHDAEVQQIRTECEKQVAQIKADYATITQQLEDDVERLETITEKLESDLKSSEERNASAVERLRQSEAGAAAKATSQDIVITGLQNELEVTKTQTKSLEEKLVIYTGLNNDLKADKETLQKQLELVTLRLPAPKVGFWARLFGGGKRKIKEFTGPLTE